MVDLDGNVVKKKEVIFTVVQNNNNLYIDDLIIKYYRQLLNIKYISLKKNNIIIPPNTDLDYSILDLINIWITTHIIIKMNIQMQNRLKFI